MSTIQRLKPPPLSTRCAVVDINTGYGAESFLRNRGRKEPWRDHCFRSLIDIAVNHREVYFPSPTREILGKESAKDFLMPPLMGSLVEMGVLNQFRSASAQDILFSAAELQTEFEHFKSWALGSPRQLRDWITYHVQSGKKHGSFVGTGTIVSSEVQNFCNDDREFATLFHHLRRHGISKASLACSFDVSVRGLQYYGLMRESALNAPYFPHPIRLPLLANRASFPGDAFDSWSWGTKIARLVKEGRVGGGSERLAELIAEIRTKVLAHRATCYDLQQAENKDKAEVLDQVASQLGLPGRLKDSVHSAISRWGEMLKVSFLGIETALAHPPTLSFALEICSIQLGSWNRNLPGWLGKIGPLRRVVQHFPLD